MVKSASSKRIVAGVFAIMLSLFAQPLSSYGQQASATINGVIYDQGGAAIAASRVTLINVDTAVERTVATNGSGAYVFLNVTPGVYTVAVEAAGFERVTQSQVKLDVDQTATFDFHMKVGQAQQTVNVEADAVSVDTSTSELGSVVNRKEVVDLPLNGRNFTQLLTLTPGVAPVSLDQTGSGGGAFVGNALGAFSFPAVQGARVRSNIFLLDGVNNLNTFLSTNNYTPIPDAIGEFKVQTHNDDTQFGGVVGGIVNVVSASGTNRYHGSLWEFLRNEQFDANSFFNNLPAAGGGIQHPRDALRQNVFGAAGGGPVSIPKLYNGKDRTFFFASYEGYRNRGVNQLSQISASPATRGGDFGVLCTEGFSNGVCNNLNHQIFDPNSSVPDPATPGSYIRSPFPNNVIPASEISPVSLAYQGIFPQGNPDPHNPGFYIAFAPGGRKTDQDEGAIRVDQNFGSHDQIFGRYAKYSQLVQTAATVVTTHLAPIYGNNWTIHETHTFGATSILDAYVARNYGNNKQSSSNPGEAGLIASLQKAGVSPTFLDTGAGIRAPGLTIGAAVGANGGGGYEGVGWWQSQSTSLADVWEYGGNYTKILGRHILKAGGSIETNGFYSPIKGTHEVFQDTNNHSPQTAGLGVNSGKGGDPYASFLLGAPYNAGNRIVEERVSGGYSDNIYFHEQWKATKNLTINAGLRYDLKLWPILGGFSGEPNPVTGQYILTGLPPNCSATVGGPCIPNGTFVDNGGKPTPYDGLPPHVIVNPNGPGKSIIKNDYGNIGFRAGIAYRINNKLSFRAGYGRFFDTWGAAAQDSQNFNGNWPATSLELNGLNPITISDPITNPLHFGSGSGSLVYPSPDPYHAGTWSVDPKYKTPYSDQFNFGFQQELPSSILLDVNYVGSVSRQLDVTDVLNVATPGPGDPVAREPFPYLGNPWFQQSIGNSNFHALEVSVNKRASRDVAFLVSYTWSKSIDDGCSGDIGAACSIQDVYNRNADRSVSSFDLTHVFSGSFTANSPYGKGGLNLDNRFLEAVVGGWAINGIVQLHSGSPYDIGASSTIPNICNCNNTERASVIAGMHPRTSGSKNYNSLWFNTAAITTPDLYTFGNLGRNSLRSQSWNNTDLSLFRQFPLFLGEGRYLEFRAEAFNAFNNVVFAKPDTNINGQRFGRVTSQANAARQLQLALKLVF